MKKRGRPKVSDKKELVTLRLRESIIKKVVNSEKMTIGKVIQRDFTEKYDATNIRNER
jgi:hypothetical protein